MRYLMKVIGKEIKVIDSIDRVSCDMCKIEIDSDIVSNEDYINIKKTFGYYSKVIGDMNSVNVDICEQCFHDNILVKINKNSK
jgi:hypothetical protein